MAAKPPGAKFDIIQHKCREDLLQKSIKLYKMVITEDFRIYPQPEMKGTIECVRRTDSKDLFLVRNPCY